MIKHYDKYNITNKVCICVYSQIYGLCVVELYNFEHKGQHNASARFLN